MERPVGSLAGVGEAGVADVNWNKAANSMECRSLPRNSPYRCYIRIMQAAQRGTGVHLTADQVAAIADDDAISTAAQTPFSDERIDELYGRG